MREVSKRLGKAVLHELPFAKFLPFPSAFEEIRCILRQCDALYVKNEVFELLPTQLLQSNKKSSIICGILTYVIPHVCINRLSIKDKVHNLIYGSSFYEHLLKRCGAFHVLNRFDFNLLVSNYGIDSSKVFLIPLGIDVAEFSPRRVIGQPCGFHVLFVGRLDSGKGIDVLCRTINHIRNFDTFKDLIFTIVGAGPLTGDVIKLSEKNNIRYLGFVDRSRLPTLYNSADIVVIPSRWETFSYVCLEALGCGVPVVTTSIPGPGDIVKDGETGLLVPIEDHVALANAILSMYRLKQDQMRRFDGMKRRARQVVLENYSLELMARRFEEMFERVVRM
jgi:glycosyltransferase involved in cell wall biosynthesis